jgi:C4-dicarboxylate transporter DctQ subunit
LPIDGSIHVQIEGFTKEVFFMNEKRDSNAAVSGFARFMRVLDKIMSMIEDGITLLFITVMTVTITVGIVMRFVLKIPNMIGEELSRYSMIVVVFIGISAGVRQRSHIGVDGLVNNLPQKAAYVVRIVAHSLGIAAYGLFSVQSYNFVMQAMRRSQFSPAMRLQMWMVYCILLAGFGLSFVRSLMMFWSDYIARENEKLPDSADEADMNFQ